MPLLGVDLEYPIIIMFNCMFLLIIFICCRIFRGSWSVQPFRYNTGLWQTDGHRAVA